MHDLPNFICDELTQRYTNVIRVGPNGAGVFRNHWRRDDRFIETIRYSRGRELHELVSVNNKPAKQLKTIAGQSISSGEFGPDINMIVGRRSSGVDLQWDHQELFHSKRAVVLRYSVGPDQTHFIVAYCCELLPGKRPVQQQYESPIRGFIYVDSSDGTILRITIRAIDLPLSFRVRESNTVIDYGPINIGGRTFILPIKAGNYIRGGPQKDRNEISFVNYRKFDAESVLMFTDSKIKYLDQVPK